MNYYNYPSTSTDIFETSDKNYFIKANKFTYLCSYEEANTIDKRMDFPDAFVLVIYKRYAVVSDGLVKYKNHNFIDGHIAKGRYNEKGYVIISNQLHNYFIQSWNKHLESYEIRDDKVYNKALNPLIFPDGEKAILEAVKMSKENNEKYVIAQWFDEFDRH